MRFADREAAGRALAGHLSRYRGEQTVVLGLPRGGVVVAWQVAQRLVAPLDVIVVRKLGVPWQPELAMGAIGEGGVRVLDRTDDVSPEQLLRVEEAEREVLDRRVALYRQGMPSLELANKTAIIVDDGIATGSTSRAACLVVRARGAARVVMAAPVGPAGVERALSDVADEVVCPWTAADFRAVGQYYDDFAQVSDDEVRRILAAARA